MVSRLVNATINLSVIRYYNMTEIQVKDRNQNYTMNSEKMKHKEKLSDWKLIHIKHGNEQPRIPGNFLFYFLIILFRRELGFL